MNPMAECRLWQRVYFAVSTMDEGAPGHCIPQPPPPPSFAHFQTHRSFDFSIVIFFCPECTKDWILCWAPGIPPPLRRKYTFQEHQPLDLELFATRAPPKAPPRGAPHLWGPVAVRGECQKLSPIFYQLVCVWSRKKTANSIHRKFYIFIVNIHFAR